MSRRALPPLILALVVGLVSTSCKRGDPAKVAAVDSLLHKADSLLAEVNALDLALYGRMDSTFKNQRDWLETQFKDTLDRQRAMILGTYHRAMNKSVGRVKKNHEEVRSGLTTSREQLTDLRHDVERGLLEKTPENGYLAEERMIMGQLEHNTDVLLRSAATARREWERYGAKVDSMRAADTTQIPVP